jgi:hypothetical protein
MKWHGNELFVAGLSNETFASTLWRKHYPFDGKRSISSIEMFHTTHNQIETRAPIRAMAFAEIDDKPTLIAAYLCTPLVTIPLDALVDGAHVRGKTIAELGYGNSPSSMIMYDRADGNGKTEPTLLITNYERSADLIPLTAVSAANAKPGLDKFVPFGNVEGIQPGEMPFAGFVRVDNLDGRFLIALRNNIETGKTQLVTFDKSINLRVTDFLTEYDFADYRYPPGFQGEVIKPIEDTLLRQEGVPSPNKP